jgi:hypothetical protein
MNAATFAPVSLFASLICACQPLNGTDPLDSGELSAAMMRPVPSQGSQQDERQHYDAQIRRLSSDAGSGVEVRKSAGATIFTDF